jgi:hypothetical protein
MLQEVSKAADPVEKQAPKSLREESKRTDGDLLRQYYKLLSSNVSESGDTPASPRLG